MFILMVTGPRKFNSRKVIWKALDEAIVELDKGKPDLLIHGDADGVDREAEAWARFHKIPTEAMPPEYDKFPKFRQAAPLARNTDLVTRATDVVAVWDGLSTGTADAVTKGYKYGKTVRVYKTDGNRRAELIGLLAVAKLLDEIKEMKKRRRAESAKKKP